MQTLSPCPRTDEYQHLLAGSLVSADQQPLLLHLEQCPQCAETIQSLLDRDTMIEAVPVTPQLADDLPQGLMDRLLALDVNVEYSGLRELGPYRIRERLGQGGMGIVFLADDPLLERTVALKVMRPSLATNQSSRQRFLREARTAAKVKSDHVVTIFQSGEERGIAYVAMERLEGSTLGARLVGGEFTIAESLRIAREMALGLAAAHEQGLVHRDIKPENIWLEAPHDRVKLLDFGLARPIDADVFLTSAGTVVGTPAFMAPEQAAGRRVDARSDLFSLGSVLYRLVTGVQPFTNENVMALLSALASEAPPSARSLNPSVPRALDHLLTRLLAKNPSDRPANARDVAEELAAIEADPSRKPPMSRRRWLAAASLPILGAGGYFAIRAMTQPDPPAPYRELRLPSLATAFVGNFELNPDGMVTLEAFITLEDHDFAGDDAQHILGNDTLSLFGGDGQWNVGASLVMPHSDAPEHRSFHFGGGNAPVGQRIHIAAVYMGAQLRIYQDGLLVANQDIGHGWRLTPSQYLGIGGMGPASRYDEIRISSVARYTSTFVPQEVHEPDEHTFALYHCDETDGKILSDSSGHGRHGTIHSGEWVSTPRVSGLDS